MDKIELEKLLEEGLSLRKISIKCELSQTTVRYWAKKYGLNSNHKSKYKWNETNLTKIVNSSESKADVLNKLGLKLNAGNYQTLKRYLKLYNINHTNLIYDFKQSNGKNQKYTNDEIFIENSIYRGDIKKRILDSNLLEHKCEICNLSNEWMGKKIVLQLDHINGINTDNTIKNLRFLCPNCHSQTETFSLGTRNKK